MLPEDVREQINASLKDVGVPALEFDETYLAFSEVGRVCASLLKARRTEDAAALAAVMNALQDHDDVDVRNALGVCFYEDLFKPFKHDVSLVLPLVEPSLAAPLTQIAELVLSEKEAQRFADAFDVELPKFYS